MEDKVKMMVAVGKALDYMKKKPGADTEETIKHVMKELRLRKDLKIKAIAAGSLALKYKERSKMSDKEIMQKIMNELDKIAKN